MKAPGTHGIPAVSREERKHVRRGQCAGAAGGEGGCCPGGSVGFSGASGTDGDAAAGPAAGGAAAGAGGGVWLAGIEGVGWGAGQSFGVREGRGSGPLPSEGAVSPVEDVAPAGGVAVASDGLARLGAGRDDSIFFGSCWLRPRMK